MSLKHVAYTQQILDEAYNWIWRRAGRISVRSQSAPLLGRRERGPGRPFQRTRMQKYLKTIVASMSTAMSSAALQVHCPMSSIGETNSRHPWESPIRQQSARPPKNVNGLEPAKRGQPPTFDRAQRINAKETGSHAVIHRVKPVQLSGTAQPNTRFKPRRNQSCSREPSTFSKSVNDSTSSSRT